MELVTVQGVTTCKPTRSSKSTVLTAFHRVEWAVGGASGLMPGTNESAASQLVSTVLHCTALHCKGDTSVSWLESVRGKELQYTNHLLGHDVTVYRQCLGRSLPL